MLLSPSLLAADLADLKLAADLCERGGADLLEGDPAEQLAEARDRLGDEWRERLRGYIPRGYAGATGGDEVSHSRP